MAVYKLVNGVRVELTEDEISAKGLAEQAWLATQVPTLEDYQRAIERHIDNVAAQKNYSSGVSCASYKDSTNTLWANESATFIAWRDDIWVYAYQELDKVQNGQREQPTVSDFIDELTDIEWPVVEE